MNADPVFAAGQWLLGCTMAIVAYGIGCLVGERLYQAWRARRQR